MIAFWRKEATCYTRKMNAQYVKEKKDGLGYNRGEHLKLFN